MSKVIISFEKDDQKHVVDKALFKAYPNSVISSYFESFPESKEITLDSTYADFDVILDMIIGKIKQWDAPEHIFQIANRFGLVNDNLCKIDAILEKKRTDTLSRVDAFLKSPDSMFIPDLISDYKEYKKIFAGQPNIIPIQIFQDCVVNIYDGIPILVKWPSWHDVVNTPEGRQITWKDTIDINAIRQKMLLTGYNPGSEVEEDYIGRYPNIYSKCEIKYLKRSMRALGDIYVDDDWYIESTNTEPPENLFRSPISAGMCDRIIAIVNLNRKAPLLHRKNNASHIFHAIAKPENENHRAYCTEFVGYCGFVNLAIKE